MRAHTVSGVGASQPPAYSTNRCSKTCGSVSSKTHQRLGEHPQPALRRDRATSRQSLVPLLEVAVWFLLRRYDRLSDRRQLVEDSTFVSG
jgi:hypothetical protein